MYLILFLSLNLYNNYYSVEVWMHEMLTPEYSVTAPHCSRYLIFLEVFLLNFSITNLQQKLWTVENLSDNVLAQVFVPLYSTAGAKSSFVYLTF
jgi:hypothetical protein